MKHRTVNIDKEVQSLGEFGNTVAATLHGIYLFLIRNIS